jgi:NADPH:quinone reductase
MKAVEITSFGTPDVLRLGFRPDAVAGVGEVLIKVAASGINRPDVLQRMGMYPVPPGASDLPGLEVAGIIVGGDAAAMASSGFKLGDRVCALVAGGGYAELCAAPVGQCLPVPKGLSDLEAASLPETFFTVWSNVFDRARLQAGETLLVQGGTSGIGVTAIQMAKVLGSMVIATAGSDDKCAACLKLGADFAINYKTQDFVEEVKRITASANGSGSNASGLSGSNASGLSGSNASGLSGRNASELSGSNASNLLGSNASVAGQGNALSNAPVSGVNVILDMVAGSYVAREVECLAEDGRLVIIAVQGGLDAQFNAGLVLRRRLQITGSTLRPRSIAFKTAIAQALRTKVWPLIEAGKIKTVIHSVFTPQDAAKAHALMETNQHIGKIVLDWSKV